MRNLFSIFLVLVFSIQTAFAAEIGDNAVVIGKKPAATGNKTITFKRAASGNPVIRWNESQSLLEYSNNGTDFSAIGSGGGGSGVNMLQEQNKNPDFESGGNAQWTNSGGTWTTATSGTNLLFGKTSSVFTASGASQYVRSALVTVPQGLQNQPCVGTIWYQGGDANLYASIRDQSGNLIASRTMGASGSARAFGVPFNCGAAGSQYRLAVESTAAAAIVSLDRAHLGEMVLQGLSQAQFAGQSYFPATTSCNWNRSSATLGSFTSSATCPGPTVESAFVGTWLTTDTDLPTQTIQNLPAGTYVIFAQGSIRNVTNSTIASIGISDGTATSGEASVSYINGQQDFSTATAIGTFTYTGAPTTRTFEIFGRTNSGGQMNMLNANAPQRAGFTIWRFPTAPEQAFTPSTVAWKVDASISGANVTLGTAAVTSYSELTNNGLTLTQNPGSILSVGIACASGTTNTVGATTCAATNESVGISFNIPAAGDYKACAEFTHALGMTSIGTEVDSVFQLIETTAASSTALQFGKDRPVSGHRKGDGGTSTTQIVVHPMRVCGEFTATSAGLKTIRLAYQQFLEATAPVFSQLNIDGDATNGKGGRDLHWTVEPKTQNVPMPVFVGPFEQTRTVSSATTLVPSDTNVIADVTAGAFTVTLPTAVGIQGKPITITKGGTGNNLVTVTTTSSQTIGASGTVTLLHRIGESITLYSDGTNWQFKSDPNRSETFYMNNTACGGTSTWYTLTNNGTADCTVTYNSEMFSGTTPSCSLSTLTASAVMARFSALSTTAARVVSFLTTSGAGNASEVYGTCTGPR